MKSVRKLLNISIEFNDTKEAVNRILEIGLELQRSQKNFGREQKNGCITEWGLMKTELEEYRVEIINGRQCMVIPSKMNRS